MVWPCNGMEWKRCIKVISHLSLGESETFTRKSITVQQIYKMMFNMLFYSVCVFFSSACCLFAVASVSVYIGVRIHLSEPQLSMRINRFCWLYRWGIENFQPCQKSSHLNIQCERYAAYEVFYLIERMINGNSGKYMCHTIIFSSMNFTIVSKIKKNCPKKTSFTCIAMRLIVYHVIRIKNSHWNYRTSLIL